MRRGEYIKFLTARGYQPVNENQVKLGMATFDIHEGDKNTAMGIQHSFCLTVAKSNVKATHAVCPRCGHVMVKSDLEEYQYLCENCDENFYEIEVKQYI